MDRRGDGAFPRGPLDGFICGVRLVVLRGPSPPGERGSVVREVHAQVRPSLALAFCVHRERLDARAVLVDAPARAHARGFEVIVASER